MTAATTEWRLAALLLPVVPLLAVLLLWPASAVVSDSLAASEGLAAPLAVVAGYAGGAAVEWRVLGSGLSAAVLPLFAGVVLTTYDQSLLVAGSTCSAYCIVHLSLLVVYTLIELGAARLRGTSWELVAAAAVLIGATALFYRLVLAEDGFNATDADTRRLLAIAGTVEVGTFLAGRAIAALASYGDGSILLVD